ncbi:MAG: 16S rRNA (guanine(527)-N(7))-methyltransferase [Chloroflexi bacterium RBG_16_50_9]|nr:MAG: 16S rRNA (guanine(527)-N(7))-methyltransferase [Chloroflexi bacterium RBG_16_50_9]
MEKLISGAQKLGLYLSREQLEQFHIYYHELVDWNRKVNLTSMTDYDEVQVKHFLDSLTVSMAMKSEDDSCLHIIDIGTGAGLPGIPLKIALAGIRLVLVEATAKKADFLRHLITKLGLDHIEIIVGRAEEIAHDTRYRESFDLVLSRAVALLPALAELTLPFCKIGGTFVAQKKGDIGSELNKAQRAITMLGGRLREVKSIGLPEFDDKRFLIIIDKVSPAPHRYPRRPGMPAKRPITS